MTSLESGAVPEDYYNYLESWYRVQVSRDWASQSVTSLYILQNFLLHRKASLLGLDQGLELLHRAQAVFPFQQVFLPASISLWMLCRTYVLPCQLWQLQQQWPQQLVCQGVPCRSAKQVQVLKIFWQLWYLPDLGLVWAVRVAQQGKSYLKSSGGQGPKADKQLFQHGHLR